MKKRVLILVLLAVLVCLAGCGKKAELTVYVVDTEPLYVAALETFQTANPDVNLVVEKFSDYAAMNDRLNTELMSGKGPDVLLLNSYQSDLDAGKLAQSGAFLPLDDFMTELDGGSYYTVITDAGKVDGKQYLLPLSWNVLQAYCSADLPTKQGLDLDNLYDAFLRQAEKLAGQDDMAISSLQVNRTDLANYFLEVAGVSLTDGKTVTADKAQVDEVMAFVKMFYDNAGAIGAVTKRYSNDLAGAMVHLSFLMEDYSFLNNLRYYQSVYAKQVGTASTVSFFGRLDGGMTAQVMHYGAINADTDMKEAAQKLLRCVLEQQCSMSFGKYDAAVAYAPVSVAGYQACLGELTVQGVQGTAITALNGENLAIAQAIPERVTTAVIPNRVLGEIVQNTMAPYFTGVADFDGCYDDMVQKLKLYLSE